MNQVSPEDQEAWDVFLNQSLTLVHEVSPSAPIGSIYAAAYKIFQSGHYVISNKSESKAENKKKFDEIDDSDDRRPIKAVKLPNKKLNKKDSEKPNSSNEKKKEKRKLSLWNHFVKYYMGKMSDDKTVNSRDKLLIIKDRWNSMSNDEKERFRKKHVNDFENQ